MKGAALLALLLLAGCGGSPAPSKPAAAPAEADCRPARVHYTAYPGGDSRLGEIPWIQADRHGLVGLLWYWPPEWQGVRRARVVTGGVMPAGYNAKVLWAFLAPSARNGGDGKLVVEGENRTGPGRFRDEFSGISYSGQNGAPSFASILDIPRPGCWRLRLTSGELRAFIDIRAVEQAGEQRSG
jgi:hypothetical protein